MMLAEIKPRSNEFGVPEPQPLFAQSSAEDDTIDWVAWEVLGCWKQQMSDRFGGGTSAPSIPRSQRQYEGDNHFEYCEIWID